MMEKWNNLEIRERLLVIGAAALIVIVIFWNAIWQPLKEQRELLGARIASSESTLTWMRSANTEVKMLKELAKRSGAKVDNRSLLAIVDSSSQKFDIRGPIQRIDPQGNDGVNVRIENADFDRLVRWLAQLAGEAGITTSNVTLTRAKGDGLVDGNLSLKR